MNKIFDIIFSRLNIRRLEQKTLVKGASSSLIMKVVGAGLGFIAQIVLARLLGITDYGAYIYIYSWLTILVIPVRLGFDYSLVRFIPEYNNAEDWTRLKGILSLAFKSVGGIGIIVVGFVAIGIFYFKGLLEEYSTTLIILAALTLPFLALSQLTSSSLRGFKKVAQALLPNLLVKHLIVITGTLLVYYIGGFSVSAEDAMGITLLAFISALGLGIYFLRGELPESLKNTRDVKETRYWLSITLPMLLITGMNVLLKRTDLIMIGSLLGQETAGIYGAVSRVSDLTVFGLQAVNLIAAPLISELYHAGKMKQLQNIVTLATRGAFGLSIIASIIFILFGDIVLGLFGAEFMVGYEALIILLFALLVNVFSGSVAYIMTMTGHQNMVAKILVLVVVLNITLNFIFVPKWGIEGAAVSTGTSMIVRNLVMLFYVKVKLEINPTIF